MISISNVDEYHGAKRSFLNEVISLASYIDSAGFKWNCTLKSSQPIKDVLTSFLLFPSSRRSMSLSCNFVAL